MTSEIKCARRINSPRAPHEDIKTRLETRIAFCVSSAATFSLGSVVRGETPAVCATLQSSLCGAVSRANDENALRGGAARTGIVPGAQRAPPHGARHRLGFCLRRPGIDPRTNCAHNPEARQPRRHQRLAGQLRGSRALVARSVSVMEGRLAQCTQERVCITQRRNEQSILSRSIVNDTERPALRSVSTSFFSYK